MEITEGSDWVGLVQWKALVDFSHPKPSYSGEDVGQTQMASTQLDYIRQNANLILPGQKHTESLTLEYARIKLNAQ